MRVLVIEDDPIVADMLLLVLGMEGFGVEIAPNGPRGLELAQRSRPDVILLDVMMPEVDGWAVAEALTGDPHLARIPIVFCTAKADEDSIWRGWLLGASSYVTKPFDNEELIGELIRATQETPLEVSVPSVPTVPSRTGSPDDPWARLRGTSGPPA